tara:strand:+ start:733 stop:1485 length:753 start_codon:yes stop_codon:yes gene_type:complete
MDIKEKIMNEIHRLYSADGFQGTDNWDKVRNTSIWQNKNLLNKDKKLYEGLQASRGLDLFSDKTFDENISNAKKMIDAPLSADDQSRLEELKKFEILDKIDNVYELGFRCPKLLKLYEGMDKQAYGFDVVNINVLIGEYLGYNCEFHDLSSDEPLFFEENSLIIAYHVFEHLPDPQKAIKKVYDGMEDNSFFHIEVPTELKINSRLGHFYAFKPASLRGMIENFASGVDKFQLINQAKRSPATQSILCTK